MRIAKVPLRVSLVGGGSDLPAHYRKYGGGVVSFTLDYHIYIARKPIIPGLFPHKYRLVYSQVEECNEIAEIKHPILRSICGEYNLRALDLDVMSDIPAGTGLGSSSAFTVGLHSLFGYYGYEEPYQAAKLACETEIDKLKEPIGKQDQYACALGGLNYLEFLKNDEVRQRPIPTYSSIPWETTSIMLLVRIPGIRSASAYLKSQELDHVKLSKLHSLAAELYEDLIRNNYDTLGPIVQEGWEIKKSLSPNTDYSNVDAIITEAKSHGALGGKLLGAGGSGFVLLVTKPDQVHYVRQKLEEIGYKTYPARATTKGVEVFDV